MGEIRSNKDGDIFFYDNKGNREKIPHIKGFAEYTNEEYNNFMLNREHPMCRCKIIIKPEDVYFTYCTLYFKWEYLEECKESLIWIN